MYTTSDLYKIAIKAPTRKSTITGTLATTRGNTYMLDDRQFIRDSFYTTNKCVNNSRLEFGTVYAGECGFTLAMDIDRYTLFDAKVKMYYNLTLDDGTVETIPLGVYNVDTATRTGKTIKITALDHMSLFDVTILEDINGYWADLVKYVANKCNVQLAQSDDELTALHVNTEHAYSIRADRIDSYRDALAYLSMVVCAFATIDREGKLKFVQFGADAVDTNSPDSRLTGCSFDDYTTKYNSVTARFIAEENYYPYTATDWDIAGGLKMDMGDIPIVGGNPKTKQAMLNSILETLTGIAYVPSSLYLSSNPALELGDMITCNDVNSTDESINTYIMEYKFEYRKRETFKAYGENPRLQDINDKSHKAISSTEQQLESKNIVVTNITNVDAYTIGKEELEIIQLTFSTGAICKPIFIATIPFTMSLDGYIEFQLYDGLNIIRDGLYKGYYTEGSHVMTFVYILNCGEDQLVNIRVVAKCYAYPLSTIRMQASNIKTLARAINTISQTQTGDIMDYDISKWEQGTTNSGANADSDTRIRNSCYIPISPNTEYKTTASSYTYQLEGSLYDGNHAHIQSIYPGWQSAEGTFTTPSNARYVRFRVCNSTGTNITTDALKDVLWQCVPEIGIISVGVDTTEPIATIDIGAIKAVSYGQGINGATDWDGVVEFTDEISIIGITSNTIMTPFDASVTAGAAEVGTRTFVQHFDVVNIAGNKILDQEEVMGRTWEDFSKLTWHEASIYTWGE